MGVGFSRREKLSIMHKVYKELREQWRDLLDDPRGPSHFCDSRFNATIHFDLGYADSPCKGLLRLVTNKSLLELDVIRQLNVVNHEVPRHGDCLVGVVLRGPRETASVDLEVGGDRVCTLDLHTDEPCLVLGSDNILPLICIQYHTVRLRTDEPVVLDLIYAYLDSCPRKTLAINSWSLNFDEGSSWLQIANGMGFLEEVNTIQTRHLVLPCLSSYSWKHSMARQKKRTETFEEELITRAWHPKRFQEWCMDLTDR